MTPGERRKQAGERLLLAWGLEDAADQRPGREQQAALDHGRSDRPSSNPTSITRPMRVTLPDGSERELEDGATGADLAASIGSGLARAALAGRQRIRRRPDPRSGRPAE
jgi:hypothetical protein